MMTGQGNYQHYQQPPPPPPYATAPQKPQTGLPVAGGALTIVAGILGLLHGLSVMLAAVIWESADSYYGVYGMGDLGGALAICGILIVIFAVMALVGGIFAIQRKNWAFALVGSILGMFAIGFLIGAILSLIALILIAVAREEFS